MVIPYNDTQLRPGAHPVLGIVNPAPRGFVSACPGTQNFPQPSSTSRRHSLIPQVLRWTSNPATASALSWELAALLATELERLSEPCPGVREWVASLSKYKVPVAIVSELDKFTVRLALQRMQLDDHFTVGLAGPKAGVHHISRCLCCSQAPCIICFYAHCVPALTYLFGTDTRE